MWIGLFNVSLVMLIGKSRSSPVLFFSPRSWFDLVLYGILGTIGLSRGRFVYGMCRWFLLM